MAKKPLTPAQVSKAAIRATKFLNRANKAINELTQGHEMAPVKAAAKKTKDKKVVKEGGKKKVTRKKKILS